MQDEAPSADVEAATSYPEDGAEVINESGYTKQQISNADKTAFYWNRMSLRTFIVSKKNSMFGFKGQDNSLIIG